MSQPQQPTSQPQPSWPQAGQNPFADQGQSPFAPGSVPLAYSLPARPLEDEPGMRWVLPVGTSGWAIAAGYFGLFSMLCFPAPISVILGIVAIWHLRKNPRLSGWGRAIFGLVMGVVFTLIPVIAMIAGAMAS
jgi:hypothetical protein